MHPTSGAITAGTVGVALIAASPPDPAVFLPIFGALAIAIVCGVATYMAAIRQTRREIKAAFDEHLAKFHREHEEILEEVERPEDVRE